MKIYFGCAASVYFRRTLKQWIFWNSMLMKSIFVCFTVNAPPRWRRRIYCLYQMRKVGCLTKKTTTGFSLHSKSCFACQNAGQKSIERVIISTCTSLCLDNCRCTLEFSNWVNCWKWLTSPSYLEKPLYLSILINKYKQNIAFISDTAVIWLKNCRYGVKYYPINQSINQSIN